VVLARELVATMPGVDDWRGALEHLSDSYPDCVTFAIDGLVGSTPETLAKVRAGGLSLRCWQAAAGAVKARAKTAHLRKN